MTGPALGLPSWLDTLRGGLVAVRPEDVSRFLVPDDTDARSSAVLILLADTDRGPSVLLIERATTLRKHAGQVAFPGGATDDTDDDAVFTALREAKEEVGLDPSSVEVFGALPQLFLPPSGFLVTPVLAYWLAPHPVSAVDPGEVAGVDVVRIADLVDPANRFRVKHPLGFTSPGFGIGELFVWGFTAGLLDYLLTLGGWAQDWDRDRVVPLPAERSGR